MARARTEVIDHALPHAEEDGVHAFGEGVAALAGEGMEPRRLARPPRLLRDMGYEIGRARRDGRAPQELGPARLDLLFSFLEGLQPARGLDRTSSERFSEEGVFMAESRPTARSRSSRSRFSLVALPEPDRGSGWTMPRLLRP
jgi:hypothetical protein